MFNKVIETTFTHADPAKEMAWHKKQARETIGDKAQIISREEGEFAGPDGMIRKLRTTWGTMA